MPRSVLMQFQKRPIKAFALVKATDRLRGLGKRVINWGYLEGQGDSVRRLINPITHTVTLVIPITNLFTKSP